MANPPPPSQRPSAAPAPSPAAPLPSQRSSAASATAPPPSPTAPLPSQRSSAASATAPPPSPTAPLPSQRPSASPVSASATPLPSQRASMPFPSAASTALPASPGPPSQRPSGTPASTASLPSQRPSAVTVAQNPGGIREPSSVSPGSPPLSSSSSSFSSPLDPNMIQQASGYVNKKESFFPPSTTPASAVTPGSPSPMASPSPPEGESFTFESGSVSKGPECKAQAVALLEKFKAPVALFPISTIEEFGFNEANGLFWMKQPAKSEKEFPDAEVVVHCARVISGNVEHHKITNLLGFKMKDVKEKNLFISVPYSEIKVDGDQVMLLSGQGDPRSFSASVFRAATAATRPGSRALHS